MENIFDTPPLHEGFAGQVKQIPQPGRSLLDDVFRPELTAIPGSYREPYQKPKYQETAESYIKGEISLEDVWDFLLPQIKICTFKKEDTTTSNYFDPIKNKQCCIYCEQPLEVKMDKEEKGAPRWGYLPCKCKGATEEQEIKEAFRKKHDEFLSKLTAHQSEANKRVLHILHRYHLEKLKEEYDEQRKNIQQLRTGIVDLLGVLEEK